MNKSVFQTKKRSGVMRLLLPVLVVAGCLFALIIVSGQVRSSSSDDYVRSLQAAISRSAVHSYAMEGRYPESLDSLCSQYGITWDQERYIVDYESNGMNRRPNITVIPRGSKLIIKEELS